MAAAPYENPGPSPRVNFASMERYINSGKTVLLVVKMLSVEGNLAQATTSDNAQVTVHLKQQNVETQFVEFQGTVEAPNQLRETDRTYFGANFDMDTYKELCNLANNQYSSYFM